MCIRDSNYTTQLLEALKTSASIPRMQKHLDLGRKVVVFHRRKQANVIPPFAMILAVTEGGANATLKNPEATQEQKDNARVALDQVDMFRIKYADLLEYEQTLNYNSAIDQISREFGDRAVFLNGDTPKKEKSNAVKRFNEDGLGVDIIVVQEESGKEGISLHDTTGNHQRVIMSMSMPISSITALQIEGRIYRIGQESDAIFEYPLLGLDLEVMHFGMNINRKLSTTENLAVGEQSRDLIRSFAEGVLSFSDTGDPNPEQGKGGKEYDRRAQQEYSEFRRSVLVYKTNQKQRGRRDSREGIDYYPTPEPVGQKMVEWLGLRPNESGLEPSAGHGAIAMWFPNHAKLTAIEPSYNLFTKLNARGGGGDRRILNETFEQLDIKNKYHGVAMNPPFGTGGKTAIEHLEKAYKHLKPYGRVAALILNGGMTDRRFEQFLYGEDEHGKMIYPEAHLVGEIILPRVAFDQAGTAISSRIVIIDKIPQGKSENELRAEVKAENVWSLLKGGTIMSPEEIAEEAARRFREQQTSIPFKRVDLSHVEKIDELFDELEFISFPERTKGQGEEQAEITPKQEEKKETFSIFTQQNTKTGETLYMVKPNVFLDEAFARLKSIAVNNNGYYSNYRNKAKNIQSGFTFKTEEDRSKFLADIKEADDIRFRNSEPFYSPTERALEKIKQEKGTPEQFKAMLLKNGAKQAELEWMGWDDQFPDVRKTITKQEIQEWIDQNKVEVEEVEKGERKLEWIENEDGDLRYGNFFLRKRSNGKWAVHEEGRGYHGDFGILETAKELAESGSEQYSDTKHSQYQLPGGSNYKELLLTMPGKPQFEIKEDKSIFGNKVYSIFNETTGVAKGGTFTTRGEAEYALRSYNELEAPENFQSPHFEEPNILAHIRFNERTDSEGNKVLFLEEIQSDFSQSYKKMKDKYMELVNNQPDILIQKFKDSNKLEVLC
jgi:hypothetical protein